MSLDTPAGSKTNSRRLSAAGAGPGPGLLRAARKSCGRGIPWGIAGGPRGGAGPGAPGSQDDSPGQHLGFSEMEPQNARSRPPSPGPPWNGPPFVSIRETGPCSKVARGKGRARAFLGLISEKREITSWRIILGSRGARPRPPAPPPGDAPLLSPPPHTGCGEPVSGGRSLQAVCLGARLISWFGDRRRFWFGDRAPVLSSSRPTKTREPTLKRGVSGG